RPRNSSRWWGRGPRRPVRRRSERWRGGLRPAGYPQLVHRTTRPRAISWLPQKPTGTGDAVKRPEEPERPENRLIRVFFRLLLLLLLLLPRVRLARPRFIK